MKTYILDIIPRIKKFSKKLNDLTTLADKHWVILDDDTNLKSVYIFRKNGVLLISINGEIQKGKWEYLDENSIMIDIKDKSYLFRQGFFNNTVLALMLDGKNEFCLMIDEVKFEESLNSLATVQSFLESEYNTYQNKTNRKTIQKDKLSSQDLEEEDNIFFVFVIGLVILFMAIISTLLY